MVTLYKEARMRVDPDDPRGKRRIPVINPKTGVKEMQPEWYARISDWRGKRRKHKFTKDKAQSQKMADAIAFEQREIREGRRPSPSPSNQANNRPFAEVRAEYEAWGASQGRRDGAPWSERHLIEVHSALNFWEGKLGFGAIGDADGCLPKVERILGEVRKTGRPGSRKQDKTLASKSLRNLVSPLDALFTWCANPARRYLPSNPLIGAQRFSAEPETYWRALEPEELQRLLASAPEYLRALIIVAIATGLRRDELRQLAVDDFDEQTSRIRLKARNTKNRKMSFKTLPPEIAEILRSWVASGRAVDLYRRHSRRKEEKQ